MNLLQILITAIATLIGGVSGALLNRSIRNEKKKNAQNTEADAIQKLHKLYIETLTELERSRKEYGDNLKSCTDEINSNREEIIKLRTTVEQQNKKIDNLTSFMELVCLDMQCTERKYCKLENILQ